MNNQYKNFAQTITPSSFNVSVNDGRVVLVEASTVHSFSINCLQMNVLIPSISALSQRPSSLLPQTVARGPKKTAILWVKSGSAAWVRVSQLNLWNYPGGYVEDLLPLLTNKQTFMLAADSKIGLTMDTGDYHLLGQFDQLNILADGFTVPVVI